MRKNAWLFILPAFLINVFVMVGPAISTFLFSFTDWDGLSKPKFVGLENFKTLFTSADYWSAAVNNLKWTGFFLVVPILLALIAASEMNRVSPRWRNIYKSIFFIPCLIPKVITARLWQQIFFKPRTGLLAILGSHGLPFLKHSFLADPTTALWAVALIDNWQWWGFLAVIFSTSIDQIEPFYFEAARLEGANRFQTLIHVIIPMIASTLVFMIIMTLIFSFLVFDFIYIVTQGGPAGSTEVLATYTYKTAFYNFDFGLGSAAASIMALFAGIPILIYVSLQKKGRDI